MDLPVSGGATLEVVSIDPRRLVLEMTWVLEAPRELLSYSVSEPAALAKWGVRPASRRRKPRSTLWWAAVIASAMQPPDGDLFHLTGEFIEIDPPRRLAYTFRWEEPTPDDRERW